MKILAIFALIVLTFTGTAFAQEKSCSFNLVGTWKVQITKTDARLYTFDDSGNVKILEVAGTAEPKEIATAKYSIDPETPEVVSFKASGKNRIFVMAEAFASQKAILKRISWADPQKSYAERVVESRARQVLINADIKKYGYRRDV